MNKITLEKRLDGSFVAATPQDAERLAKIKIGDAITVDYSKPRNYGFHKKWFSLVSYAFECWEPEDGPEKNFERFRKEITMLTGYYHEVPCIKGGTRIEADSISFASMDDVTFDDLYYKTVTVLLKWVLKNYTRDDVDRVMANISDYVA